MPEELSLERPNRNFANRVECSDIIISTCTIIYTICDKSNAAFRCYPIHSHALCMCTYIRTLACTFIRDLRGTGPAKEK